MKKKFFAGAACALAACVSLCGCSAIGGDLLVKPAKAASLAYEDNKEEGFVAFKTDVEKFAAKFAFGAYARAENDENVAVSPLSVFFALSLASECASGQTKDELLSALGVSETQIVSYLPTLYRAMNLEYKSSGYVGETTTGVLKTTNSIWIDDSVDYNLSCVEKLAENYYCYPYKADFKNKNGLANYSVRQFVKEQTNGLIDEDFELDEETLFTFVNTVYLKALWNAYGDKIGLTDEVYRFVESSGETEETRLMIRGYISGRAFEGEGFKSFYTTTYNGFKLKFILPNEGVGIDEVFTSENIFAANTVSDYNAIDEENKIEYYTRCLFPQFEAEYDEDVRKILKEDFGVSSLFDATSCDLSVLSSTSTLLVCGGARHVVELSVDRRGIEGAAATTMPMAGAPGPGEYTRVDLDFVVDRAFGFVITDRYNTTIFSGVVNEL